ncbi:MAG: FISUMP domain-containing protein [Bacteroidota bacterium]
MKKNAFLFLIIFTTTNIYSQNYNISFAGTGASTTVNSVKVDNLTQNTSVTLNTGDVLHLGTVGINETLKSNEKLYIYPNPMQGKSELSFYANKDGDAHISIVDIAGKEVIHTGKKFNKGIQNFLLTGLKQGMYFVNICSETYFYTSKLISQYASHNEATIEYIGSDNSTTTLNKLKTTTATVNMAYTTGDRLLFKGISGNYSNIITNIPTTSKTITFNFTACSDLDNNYYSTVLIGTQIWMAENLKTTHYNNGDSIPNVTGNAAWLSIETGKYCNYNNTPANSTTYGRLYNWYAVNTGNLCPTGWHEPTNTEWTALTTYLGGESMAGGKLKEVSFVHWNSPNTSATNETGFTALPGGFRSSNGAYNYLGDYGYWWSYTEYFSTTAWYRYMLSNNSNAYSLNENKADGFSVRCIKD